MDEFRGYVSKRTNVIDYDVAEIIFHGTLEYDESGRPVGQPKDSDRMLLRYD